MTNDVNFSEFTTNVSRTESVIDKIVINEHVLKNSLEAFESVAEILDQVKRRLFYGTQYDTVKVQEMVSSAFISLSHIAEALSDCSLYVESEVEGVSTRFLHGIIGNATESGELVSATLSALDGKPLDGVNISEEIGDQSYYTAIALDDLNIQLQDSLDKVINKLRVRYPNKFDADLAVNRTLDKERVVLEGDAAVDIGC